MHNILQNIYTAVTTIGFNKVWKLSSYFDKLDILSVVQSLSGTKIAMIMTYRIVCPIHCL